MDAEIAVEYESKGKRVRKDFDDAYVARRFYSAKDKAGKRPRVVGTRPKSVAAYVRVSTVGQNEAGQRAEIERWLLGNGIPLANVAWFVDKKSGDSLDRPAFKALQSAIFAGEIKTVAVYKLDRLSRKLHEGIAVLCDWAERGLRVVSVTQLIDFSGTIGKLLAAVLLAIAEMEQETRRERQRAGIDEAKKRGVYRGRKRGTFKTEPGRALALRKKGLRPEEIAKSLGVSRNTVFRYLRTVKD